MTDPERELLSAAYDRQTNPAEQARVEELRASDEARREWEEFEQLSGLLKELPRHELPAEFPSRVLKIAEQRSLLPTPAARRARPRWIAPFVTAAAALSVVVGVAWFTSPPRTEMGVAMQNADSAKYATPPAPAEAPPQTTRAMPEPFAESAFPPAPAGVTAPAYRATPAPQGDVSTEAPADRALPGQIVQQSWGNVDVVAVYLVDSVDGVQAVQSAFAKNAVVTTGKEVKQQATKVRDDVEGDEALLIVASNEQIEKSLEDLKKSHTVASVVDEDAVEIAKLSSDVKQFFLADVSRSLESAETVRMQREEQATEAIARKSEKPAESATGTVPATRRSAPAKDVARQQTAIVSEFYREEARQELAPAPAVTAPAVTEAVKAKSEEELAKSGTAWRRLIVLVRRSPPPAAAAPAKP